jgi:hypothetical protein
MQFVALVMFLAPPVLDLVLPTVLVALLCSGTTAPAVLHAPRARTQHTNPQPVTQQQMPSVSPVTFHVLHALVLLQIVQIVPVDTIPTPLPASCALRAIPHNIQQDVLVQQTTLVPTVMLPVVLAMDLVLPVVSIAARRFI